MSDSYVADAYDELLSQSEVQGHVTKVNLLVALEEVEAAVKGEEGGDALYAALLARPLGIRVAIKQGERIIPFLSFEEELIYLLNLDVLSVYKRELLHALQTSEEGFLRAKDIQTVIEGVNKVDGG